MVAKPLCHLYKNIIKPLDRDRYPELRYGMKSSNNFQLRKSLIIKTKIVRMTKKPSIEDAYMMSFFFPMAK